MTQFAQAGIFRSGDDARSSAFRLGAAGGGSARDELFDPDFLFSEKSGLTDDEQAALVAAMLLVNPS